jgi:lysophospholipase L1-like esterase
LEWLLHTHWPVDLVVVMLGTNDIKDCFWLDTKSISSQMEEKIIKLVQRFWCKLLIISPPAIIDWLFANFPTWSNSKIQELNKYYQELCQKYSVDYVDIQDKLICWSDGIHLTLESHQLLWKTLAQKIKEIL